MRGLICIALVLPLISFARLEWKKTTIDYQATTDDESVTALYYFANTGAAPVKILSTKTSCGCTVAKLDKEIYEPGEMGTVEVTFTFDARVGKQSKNVQLYTNDPDRPAYLLTLNVDIPPFLSVEPQTLFWTLDEEPKPKTSIITVLADMPVEIVESSSNDELNFSYELESLEEGRRYAVTLTPLQIEKPAQVKIKLTTNVGKESPRLAFVLGQVQ